jgi:hypothetical protein
MAALAIVLFAFQVQVGSSQSTPLVTADAPKAEASVIRTCTVTASAYQVYAGTSVIINWYTQGFDTYTLNGEVVTGPSGSKTFTNVQENTTFTLVVTTADGKYDCTSSVTVLCIPVPPPTCTLTPATKTIMSGESVDLTWTTTNAASATLTSFGSVALSGTKNTGPLASTTTYTLSVLGNDGSTVNCHSNITVTPIPVPPPTCTLTPATATIDNGASVDIVWTTTNAASATLTSFGEVPLNGTRNTGPLTASKTYTLDVVGTNGTNVSCQSVITVKPIPVPPPTCTLTPATVTINSGESVTLTWITANASTTNLTDFGSVPANGTRDTGALFTSKTYTLTVLGTNGTTVSCHSVINIKDVPPAPSCDAFTATPGTILKGASSTLAWQTTNATRVVIDNGIGERAVDGTVVVSPLATSLYTLTAYTAAGAEVRCTTTVTVEEPPLTPSCESFSASPATLPVGGGSTVLSWVTVNGTSVSIAPSVGTVALTGSTTVNVSTTTTYTLTVAGVGTQSDSCVTTVVVTPPEPIPFTCANNVSLSASPTSITRGNSSVISWSTTNVDTVSFNQGITATGLSGSVTVEPTDTTTYTLTAMQSGKSIACPVTVTVTTGGGGGGSVSPTCELTISKNKISRGETVTLRWDSSRATELILKDSKGKTLVTTEDKLADDKEEFFDGSLRVSPTSDTTYTLTVERGSRERVCKVSVDVEDTIVVTEVRDQQPLVTGISLTEVPYTGFQAGPFMTFSFYVLLMAWALYIAYVLVIKRDMIGGYALARNHIVAEAPTPEEIRPDVFVTSVRPSMPTVQTYAPQNLPTAVAPTIGYAAQAETTELTPKAQPAFAATDEVVTTLENYAHAKKALLSSDAIRHLIGATTSMDESIATLGEVISESKARYPSEDGWVVINERRMRELCAVCQAAPTPSSAAPFVPTVIPEGSGSLAEAIVTGNIVAAYEMIGHRPMFALADAAADMDSVLRARRGGKEVISNLLTEVTASLSEEQIIKIIEALTGALDGTYSDEASAVKMAIMKAVKVVA